ncbi:hypothetical protein WDU94_011760 [Cyamophila willieti]
MSWYSNVLKEIDGYNDNWRSKLVEAWTEGDIYNWIVSSARLTLVPLNELPFDQFHHVTGKQLVKWKVSNFVQRDVKNGVFLYLYLQDIISHHKGKVCRSDLVSAALGITTEVDPAIKDELVESVRVPNISILHTNTWRKKNLSDWTGLDVYHWLVHLCKEHHIPLDKFPFTEFEDFDGMRLLLLSGNDYQKKSQDYGLFIYQSINQLILHNSDSSLNSSLNSGHNEDEFATIFTSTNNTPSLQDYQHTHSNYYVNQQHPPYNDLNNLSSAQATSTNLSLSHSLSPSPSFTTLDDKMATSVKSELRYPTPPPGYPANPLEYLQQHQSSQHESSLNMSHYSYPSQTFSGYPHVSQHDRTSTFTNMDAPSHDRTTLGHHPWKQVGYYNTGDSGDPGVKLEHVSPGTEGTSSHDYSTSPSDQYPIYPSSQRRKPPPHQMPYHSDIGGHYPSYTPLHSGDLYYDTPPDKTSVSAEKQVQISSRSGKPLPSPPPLIPKSMYKKAQQTPTNTNDLNKPATSCHVQGKLPEQTSSEVGESHPTTGTKTKSSDKKKSTSTPEKKANNKSSQDISKPKGIPYSVLTAYKDSTKLTIKFVSFDPSKAGTETSAESRTSDNTPDQSSCPSSEYNPSLICWEKYEEGKFRFVQSDKVAALWGDTKHNETYNYEKFSRAMRYYYKHDILRSVDGRLIYQFGANAVGWRTDNPIDAGDRVSINTNMSRPVRSLSQVPIRSLIQDPIRSLSQDPRFWKPVGSHQEDLHQKRDDLMKQTTGERNIDDHHRT